MWFLVSSNYFHQFKSFNYKWYSSFTVMERNHLSHLSIQLEQIQNSEESMWAQRAKIKFLKEGSRNTKIFHHTGNRNRSKNHISLLEINGEETCNQSAISDASSHFYHNLMRMTTPSGNVNVNWEQYYLIISCPSLINLKEFFTEEEFRWMVFSLGAGKAPGYDGFNMRFYQYF